MLGTCAWLAVDAFGALSVLPPAQLALGVACFHLATRPQDQPLTP